MDGAPHLDWQAELAGLGLAVSGVLDAQTHDNLPGHVTHIALLSPAQDFWAVFSASPEYADGAADPMDRWSAREITALATRHGALPLFPFGASPSPFFSWAQRSGSAWPSPVHLLAGAAHGLMISYRGALGLSAPLDNRDAPSPCLACAAPCVTACPIGALTPGGYDVDACRAYLRSEPQAVCHTGCLVRRACPASPTQPEAQRRFHMEAFLG